MLMWRLITRFCLIALFYPWTETVKQTRYYIVVPASNLTSGNDVTSHGNDVTSSGNDVAHGTSAVFKQRQLRTSTVQWECPDGRNPIVYTADDATYKIQAKSIDITSASESGVRCIGLNVRVVQKQLEYIWLDVGESADSCFGYLTKTNKLQFDERAEEDIVTIDFELSPPTWFEVYSVPPSTQCLKKTLVRIKPPTVVFRAYDQNSMKPTACSVVSRDEQYLSCNMSLLAQFDDQGELETFSVVSHQTQIVVPDFIWNFRPNNILCKSICILSTSSENAQNVPQIASEVHTPAYPEKKEYQVNSPTHEPFYIISSYVFGGMFLVCVVIIVSLIIRNRATARQMRGANRHLSQLQTHVPYVDAGGYSRIRQSNHVRSKTRCALQHAANSLPAIPTAQYNTVALKLTECLDIQNVHPTAVRNTTKVYEKLTF